MLRRTFLTRLQWHSLQTDIVAYIIQVYIIVNTSSHGIMNITWLWIGLYSQNFYQKKRVLHRSVYIEPVLTSCEEGNAFADPFFRIYLCLSRDFCQLACSFAARFTLRQPQTPEFADPLFYKDYDYVFLETLSCETCSLDLCILFKFIIFYTSDTFRPILALFTHFVLLQLFLMYITTRNIFPIPGDAVDRRKLGI